MHQFLEPAYADGVHLSKRVYTCAFKDTTAEITAIFPTDMTTEGITDIARTRFAIAGSHIVVNSDLPVLEASRRS
jgi:hypothetical protein